MTVKETETYLETFEAKRREHWIALFGNNADEPDALEIINDRTASDVAKEKKRLDEEKKSRLGKAEEFAARLRLTNPDLIGFRLSFNPDGSTKVARIRGPRDTAE